MQKRIILGILILIWMITIFLFSSQDGMESESTSDIITNRIVNENIKNDIEGKNYSNEGTNETSVTEYNYEYEMYKGGVRLVVRKSAHFIIYLVGGILVFNFLKTYNLSIKKIIGLTILFILIYASTDEFHQLFVEGRTARVSDVLLDTCGAICGLILIFICSKILKLKDRNK